MQLNKNSKIFIAGHNGMVGSSILKYFKEKGYKNIYVRERKALNLLDQDQTVKYLKKTNPHFVIIAAARVGGILANKSYPAEFITDNLVIQSNVIQAAYDAGVHKLLFLGSSCIYPQLAKQPMSEDCLLSGKLEPTNEPYAIAKIAGIKMCESYNRQYGVDYRCVMPTNLYGENDNFDISSSHVIPGLITKFLQAKKKKTNVKIWGTGKPIREFLHVEDLAQAIFRILKLNKIQIKKINKNKLPILNVGSGESLTIKKLALMIKKISKFKGKVFFDKTFPDGTINKNLDSSKIKKFNWAPKIKLSLGLKNIIESRQKLF